MGACASKPWEIDLKDICQRYVAFLHVVEVKSLSTRLKLMAQNLNLKSKMTEKIYDPRLVWPYSLLLCGPTGCGKTTWIVELLKRHEELCLHTPKKLIWIYGVEQPDLFETIGKIWFPHQCEFINGFLEDLLTCLEQMSDHGSLCIFDDVMNKVSSNSMISKLFTRGRTYLGCSLVLMLQNIFPKGTQSRIISINAQYQVLFRNPRDSLQISIFAHQLCPHNSRDFQEIYKELHKDRMDNCFVVLLNLVLMKSVITQTFYRMNICPLCINFNFTI